MSTTDTLIHTFLDGDTMMLRIIEKGQVWQWALSLKDITSIAATIAEWQVRIMHRIAEQYAQEGK